MLTAVFGSTQTRKSSWRTAFGKPSHTVTAHTVDDVRRVVEAAENATVSGNYAVLMLSYEAAPAFDNALRTHQSVSFPLAWAAIFESPSQLPSSNHTTYVAGRWEPRVRRNQYDHNVEQIHNFIRAGDTYQVNYSFPLTTTFRGNALDWYLDLCLAQDAYYSAYLDLGQYKVISLSPELFFEKAGNKVTARPMKGTARRGRWTEEDQAYASGLAHSAKDRAENVMIVDLLRNDLGKVSIPGSVHVPKLFELERFETLWQMTSTIASTLKDGTRLFEILGALFPCGSITGAPKIRTMEIIRELEPYPRGAYTGTIGLIRPGGDCTFNVAIRTIVLDSHTGEATFGVGGGITISSTPEGEYEECLVKSNFLHRKPAEFNLFESMLLADGQYFLFHRHLERLSRSASFFSFECDLDAIHRSLVDLSKENSKAAWKVKIELEKNGQVRIDAEKISVGNDVKRVALASQGVDSSNRFLFHKTTLRDFYSSELVSRPDCDDIIFWNERGEITESSIANVVVPVDGRLVTPPLESGLLAGTFRDELLTEGEIFERVITIEELRAARQFFLINSVRKWMRAEWQKT